MNADQNYIGLADGSVTQARAMVRLIPNVRWDIDRVERIAGTPTELFTLSLDAVEEAMEPHDHIKPADENNDGDAVLEEAEGRRRLKISQKDLEKLGYSPGCPKCRLALGGNKARARIGKHLKSAGNSSMMLSGRKVLRRCGKVSMISALNPNL